MEVSAKAGVVTRIHEIYIKAPQHQIWEAITTPAWTEKYGYGVPAEFDLKPGGALRYQASQKMKSYGLPDTIIDGEVFEADPPRKLIHSYRWLADVNYFFRQRQL